MKKENLTSSNPLISQTEKFFIIIKLSFQYPI
jgi:hypothetical protein